MFSKESEELDSNPVMQLRVQIDIRNEAIGFLMRLFENAGKSGKPSDNLYVDHLIYRFTLPYGCSLSDNAGNLHIRQGALPAHDCGASIIQPAEVLLVSVAGFAPLHLPRMVPGDMHVCRY
jgi:hypothetical protein